MRLHVAIPVGSVAKSMRGRHLLSLGAALAAATTGLSDGVARELPASAFSGLPEMSEIRVSPDGSRILMLRRVEGSMQPFVGDLRTGHASQAISVKSGKQILRGCEWASNERIVCSWLKYPKLTGRDGPQTSGYPAREGRTVRLLAVDHDGGNPLELVPPLRKPQRVMMANARTRMSRLRPSSSEPDHRVVSYLPADSQHILVSTPREYLYNWSVYRLNIHNNRMSAAVAEISPRDMNALRWSADLGGTVLIGTGISLRPTDGTWGDRQIAVREAAAGYGLVDAPWFDNKWLPPRVLGFSADGTSAYVESSVRGSGRLELHQVDSSTLELQRLLAADDNRDVAAEAVVGASCGVVGFDHLATADFTWLDSAFGQEVAALDAKLAGNIQAIPSMTADCSQFVAVVHGGRAAPTWYLHHRGTDETRRLGAERPLLEGRLAETRTMEYRTRDGRRIQSVLALPLETGDRPAPLVVVPSGGQLGQVEGYDPWVEFLASRGYAVLRPASRGTPGYGVDHWRERLTNWGRKLQEDLADGVAALAASGVVDPQRVCYAGRARGGYMALAGSAGGDSPARCAATFAFVDADDTDRLWDQRDLFHYWRWTSWLGTPTFWVEGDALRIAEDDIRSDGQNWRSAVRSPLLDGGHPGIPLLIAGSTARGETIEHRKQARSFQKAVDAAGKLERMWYRGSEREVAFLEALEHFLAAEIGLKE